MTIFFFDDPNANKILVWALFIGVNLYPLYLFVLFELNARIYYRYNIAGYVIPLFIIGTISYIFLMQYLSTKQYANERKIENQKRKEVGFLGSCDTYKIKNDSIYYIDEPIYGDPKTFKFLSCSFAKDKNHVYWKSKVIENCDPASFLILNKKWQKDKNQFYYYGMAATYLDYNSFEILDLDYSKDKNNVYYIRTVIEGADPKTFQVNSMTHIAKDKNYSYRNGKRITNH